MYGLKRIEYGEHGQVTAVEFHPDVSGVSIELAMKALGLLKPTITRHEEESAQGFQAYKKIPTGLLAI